MVSWAELKNSKAFAGGLVAILVIGWAWFLIGGGSGGPTREYETAYFDNEAKELVILPKYEPPPVENPKTGKKNAYPAYICTNPKCKGPKTKVTIYDTNTKQEKEVELIIFGWKAPPPPEIPEDGSMPEDMPPDMMMAPGMDMPKCPFCGQPDFSDPKKMPTAEPPMPFQTAAATKKMEEERQKAIEKRKNK